MSLSNDYFILPTVCAESERVMRVTRSQLQPATRQRAIEILEESTQVINVDQDRLEQLLNKAVLKTEGCSIDELERLHSMMSQCLCQHRMNYEKSQLLQVTALHCAPSYMYKNNMN